MVKKVNSTQTHLLSFAVCGPGKQAGEEEGIWVGLCHEIQT